MIATLAPVHDDSHAVRKIGSVVHFAPLSAINMLLDDESTWPRELVRFLDERRADLDYKYGRWGEVLAGEHRRDPSVRYRTPTQRERRSYQRVEGTEQEFGRLLRKVATLASGYHCTRLTNFEIERILNNGMQLQNLETLRARIEAATLTGLVSKEVARRLLKRHGANEQGRTGKLWFFFYQPWCAGIGGFRDFFSCWGGESLYNFHENDPITGPALRNTGTPSIVEADIPVASLGPRANVLTQQVIARYFRTRGFKAADIGNHSDYVVTDVPTSSIRRVHRFPEETFIQLSRCNEWKSPLQ